MIIKIQLVIRQKLTRFTYSVILLFNDFFIIINYNHYNVHESLGFTCFLSTKSRIDNIKYFKFIQLINKSRISNILNYKNYLIKITLKKQ